MNSVLVEPIGLETIEAAVESGDVPVIQDDLSVVGHVMVRMTALLGDVELPLSELFDLKPGAVVTLDRQLDEPVTLALDGKAVATGHLVAVGEHFGVQIERVL